MALLVHCAGSAAHVEPARGPAGPPTKPTASSDVKPPESSRDDAGSRSAVTDGARALSYEDAVAIADANKYPTGNLTDADLMAPMRNAAWLTKCGAPKDMKATVKVAIWKGRVFGASIYTSPPDAAVASCAAEAVRKLEWPSESEATFYSFVTTY